MTPGGGRGWFHRKRSQPADPPTPDPSSTPEATADRDPRTAESTSSAGSPLTPARVQSERPWISEPGSTTPTTHANSALDNPPSFAPSVASDLAPADERDDARTALSPTSGPNHQVDATIARSPGIDWDAETAAALSGDGNAMSHPSGPSAPDAHAAPDRLLEDLIREIVGDAAADTASSLHAPRPTNAADEAMATTPSPGAEATQVEEQLDAGSQTTAAPLGLIRSTRIVRVPRVRELHNPAEHAARRPRSSAAAHPRHGCATGRGRWSCHTGCQR